MWKKYKTDYLTSVTRQYVSDNQLALWSAKSPYLLCVFNSCEYLKNNVYFLLKVPKYLVSGSLCRIAGWQVKGKRWKQPRRKWTC